MVDPFAAAPRVYLLALLPAILWGVEPVVSKRGMARGGTTLQAAVVVVAVDAAVYWSVLLARRGLDVFETIDPRTLAVFALAGVVGTALGRLAVFASVRRIGASITAAGNGVRPIVATLLAAGLLGEGVGPSTGLGILCIAAGLAAFAVGRGGDRSGWERRDLLFPIAAASAFAVGNVLRRFGLQSGTTVLEAVAVNETAALVVLLGYVLVTGKADRLLGDRRALPVFVVSGLLTALALVSLFTALSLPEGRVAIVESLSSLAPLFTPAFAFFLLRDVERVTPAIVAGVVLSVTGTLLVTLGPPAFG
jgi:uncharacterized membrane protein